MTSVGHSSALSVYHETSRSSPLPPPTELTPRESTTTEKVQSALANFAFSDTSPTARTTAEAVLNLQPVGTVFQTEPNAPLLHHFYQQHTIDPAKFSFTTEEEALIRDLFNANHLGNQICLIDLLSVALHTTTEHICRVHSKNERCLTLLSHNLLLLYLHILRERNPKIFGRLHPTFQKEFYTSPTRLQKELTDLSVLPHTIVQDKLSNIEKTPLSLKAKKKSTINKTHLISKFEKLVDLLCKCYNSPYADQLLLNNNITCFPGSNRQEPNPVEAMESLIQYNTIICHMFDKAHHDEIIHVHFNIFEQIADFLQSAKTNKETLYNFPHICVHVVEKLDAQIKTAYEIWKTAILTPLPSNPTIDELLHLESLLQNAQVLTLAYNFVKDFYRILESCVLPSYPDYISRSAFIDRLRMNAAVLSMPKTNQAADLDTIKEAVRPVVQEQIQKVFAPYIDHFKAKHHYMTHSEIDLTPPASITASESAPEVDSRYFRPSEFATFESDIDDMLEILQNLPKHTQELVKAIDEALDQLPLAQQCQNDLLDVCQEICFEECLEVCRLMFILHDAGKLIQHPLIEELPETLANFIELDELQAKLFQKQIRAWSISIAGFPSSKTPMPSPTKKLNMPIFQSENDDDAQPVKLETRNVRKVLQRLKAMGLVPIRTRGDHVILKRADQSGPPIPIPLGNGEIPTGTLKAINRRVEAAQRD